MKTAAVKTAPSNGTRSNGTGKPRKDDEVRQAASAKLNKIPKAAIFPVIELLAKTGLVSKDVNYAKGATIFSQGDPADTVFCIEQGQVKIAVVSARGKEATVAILNAGEFVGEECISTPHPVRLLTATALTECKLIKMTKKEIVRSLDEDSAFSNIFVTFLMARNASIQTDLIDQLFNSSEKRLARVLLQLSQFAKEDKPERVIPKISQESLAEMVGTTRSRVSYFMNRFRRLGFITYNGEIKVHSSLLAVVLHD